MAGVLVDTSVWVNHFQRHNYMLAHLLTLDLVMMHPLIVGEIACGTPPDRKHTLINLDRLQPTQCASIREAMNFIEREQLFGLGCGLIGLLLLVSTILTPGVKLWTFDKRLQALTKRFGVMYQEQALSKYPIT